MAWDKQGGGAGRDGGFEWPQPPSGSRRKRQAEVKAMPEEGAIVWCLTNMFVIYISIYVF